MRRTLHLPRSSIVVFLLFAVLVEMPQSEAYRVPPRYLKKCGHQAKMFLQWFCSDETFDFPFPFRVKALIEKYPPPAKSHYPFQHQASVCCRRGCQEIGFSRMCGYHKVHHRCGKGVDRQTDEGRRKRANCLLEVDTRLQPTGKPRTLPRRLVAPFELSAVRKRRSLRRKRNAPGR